MIAEIGLIADDKEFNWDGSFIALTYLYELRKIPFIKFKRINLFIYREGMPSGVFGENAKICNVSLVYNFQNYHLLKTENEKSHEILNKFHQGFMLLCEKLNWDKTIFKNIKEMIVERNFEIEIPGKKVVNKGANKICASLSIYPGMKSNKFYLNFEKNNDVFCSLLIYEGMPGWIYWDRLFNNQYWKDENVFIIANEDNDIFFECRWGDCAFELTYGGNLSPNEVEKKLKLWHCKTKSNDRNNIFLHKSSMVSTTVQVIEKKSPIIYVSHGIDGAWKFLNSQEPSKEDMLTVPLIDILNLDSSIESVLSIPAGFYAQRDSSFGEWMIN